MTFIFKGIDVSLVNYAEDVLNVSRTQAGIEEKFRILSGEYNSIGLHFNYRKREILVFNRHCQDPVAVPLGVLVIKDQKRLKYLGVPIGKNPRSTRILRKDFFANKTRKAYGLLLVLKFKFNRHINTTLYNAFVVPHLLALAPFWSLFSQTDVSDIKKYFHKYAKYLLILPLWTSNATLSTRHGVASPVRTVEKRNELYITRLGSNSTLLSVFR